MQGPFQAICTSELRLALILANSLTHDTNISHAEHSFHTHKSQSFSHVIQINLKLIEDFTPTQMDLTLLELNLNTSIDSIDKSFTNRSYINYKPQFYT